MKLRLLIVWYIFSTTCAGASTYASDSYDVFSCPRTIIDALAKSENIILDETTVSDTSMPVFSAEHVIEVCERFISIQRKALACMSTSPSANKLGIRTLCTSSHGLGYHEASPGVYTIIRRQDAPNMRYKCIGDLHGDVGSLVLLLRAWQKEGLVDPDNIFKIAEQHRSSLSVIATGDYVDRGNHGIETLVIMLKFLLNNPTSLAIRGNHEDIEQNMVGTEQAKHNGYTNTLQNEVYSKYGKQTGIQILETLSRVYDVMPVALYLGTRDNEGIWTYLLLSHGCIDVRYNPHPLLSAPDEPLVVDTHAFSDLSQCQTLWRSLREQRNLEGITISAEGASVIQHHCSNNISLSGIGFAWNDIIPDPEDTVCTASSGLRFALCKQAFKVLCKASSTEQGSPSAEHASRYRLWGNVSAHQHGDILLLPYFFGGSMHKAHLEQSAAPWVTEEVPSHTSSTTQTESWYPLPEHQCYKLPATPDSFFSLFALKRRWHAITAGIIDIVARIEDFELRSAAGMWLYKSACHTHTALKERLLSYMTPSTRAAQTVHSVPAYIEALEHESISTTSAVVPDELTTREEQEHQLVARRQVSLSIRTTTSSRPYSPAEKKRRIV